MKKIALYLSLLLLIALTVFSFTACANNDGYSKADVDAFIARLDEAIAQKADATESAIATLKADYDAKIEALENETETVKSEIEELTASYNAKIEALEKADADNAKAILALQAETATALGELKNKVSQNEAKIRTPV